MTIIVIYASACMAAFAITSAIALRHAALSTLSDIERDLERRIAEADDGEALAANDNRRLA